MDDVYNDYHVNATHGFESSEELDEPVNETVIRPGGYIFPVFCAVALVVGLLGNGTLIRIFIAHRRTLCSVPNLYICNLAFAHLLVIIFYLPFSSTMYTFVHWPYELWPCKLMFFSSNVGAIVSAFTFAALTAHCCFARGDLDTKFRGWMSIFIPCVAIVVIWIISIVLALPWLHYATTINGWKETEELEYCYLSMPWFDGDDHTRETILEFSWDYALPLGITLFFYMILACRLALSKETSAAEYQDTQQQGKRKMAKMVTPLATICFLCILPFRLVNLLFNLHKDRTFTTGAAWGYFHFLSSCLLIFSFCANPVALYYISGTFRKYFKKYLFCWVCRENRGTPETDELTQIRE